jgi:hypothetical protein
LHLIIQFPIFNYKLNMKSSLKLSLVACTMSAMLLTSCKENGVKSGVSSASTAVVEAIPTAPVVNTADTANRGTVANVATAAATTAIAATKAGAATVVKSGTKAGETVKSATPAAMTPAAGSDHGSVTPNPTGATANAPTTAAVTSASEKITSCKFEELVYNWGSIKKGDKMTHIFKFKNTGTEPLVILSAKGSCGCTVPEKPQAPIEPGKTGEIKVVFDSAGKDGQQAKTITVEANTKEKNMVLTIKGEVK